MARARAGTAGIRRAAQSRCPRRARVPAGPAHALPSQCRRRACPGDHGRARRVHRHRTRGRLCGRRDRERARPAGQCGGSSESFVRTFAYMSGPAYGLLLDASSPGWTRRVRGTDDLATLVMRALAVQPATDATASATRYGGAELRASEQQREQERQERLAELRRRFVDGPVLLIPGGGSGMSDSRGAVVIPGVGTVYFGPYRCIGRLGHARSGEGRAGCERWRLASSAGTRAPRRR